MNDLIIILILMAKVDFDRDISALTRFAEGVYQGLKVAVCHSFTLAVYISKENATINKTSYSSEYVRHMARATVICPVLIGAIFGNRQLVLLNRDRIILKLYGLHTVFRKIGN